MKNPLHVYCDGSYNTTSLIGGWGFVAVVGETRYHEASGQVGNHPTSDKAEHFAVSCAIDWLFTVKKRPEMIFIYSDSRSVLELTLPGFEPRQKYKQITQRKLLDAEDRFNARLLRANSRDSRWHRLAHDLAVTETSRLHGLAQ